MNRGEARKHPLKYMLINVFSFSFIKSDSGMAEWSESHAIARNFMSVHQKKWKFWMNQSEFDDLAACSIISLCMEYDLVNCF